MTNNTLITKSFGRKSFGQNYLKSTKGKKKLSKCVHYLSELRGDEVFKYPSVVVRGLIFGSASYDF